MFINLKNPSSFHKNTHRNGFLMENFKSDQSPQSNSLRDILVTFFKHKYKVGIIFFTTVFVVTIGSFLIPHTYEAKSSLLVKFGREHIYRSEVGNAAVPRVPFIMEKLIDTETKIITSRDLIEKTIKSLGVASIYPELTKNTKRDLTPLEAATSKFQKSISVESKKESDVISISFEHENPITTARVVNRLVELLKEKHIEVFSNLKSSFLKKQLNTYLKRLNESESKLELFKKDFGIYNQEEQISYLLKQRVDTDASLKAIENQIIENKEKIKSLNNQLANTTKNVPLYTDKGGERSRIIDDANEKLLALKIKEQEILGKYKLFNESKLWLAEVRKEIALVKKFLKDQKVGSKESVRTGKNIIYQQIEMDLIKSKAQLNSLNAKYINVEEQITNLDEQMRNFDLKGRELKKLNRELALNESNYNSYLQKLEEARISKEMDMQKMANISVIQKAIVPKKPIRPNKRVNVMVGILLGAFAGLIFAFFCEYISYDVSTPKKAESLLGLPILTTVSYKG